MPGVSPGVRTAGENRLQASTDAIPEVSRQKYQEAALSGLIAVGQEIPDDWVPGDQFAFSADGRFRMGEVVVVATNDGNLRFGRVKSITSSGQEAPGSYTVSVSESRLGTRYKELAAEQVGKVLPLSQREIQRLGSSDLSSNGSKTTTIRNGGFFSSFRNLVDVDKTLGREETLPFQPMLSRRAMTPADSKMVPKPAGRVSTVMSGADSGDWGELDGWWRNEQDQTDTFEVLLQRPLGMELDEVDGEGIFVKALEDGGNAQRAGIRVGDRILVPGKEAARGSSWRDDLVSVLSAISDSTGNRMRYARPHFSTCACLVRVCLVRERACGVLFGGLRSQLCARLPEARAPAQLPCPLLLLAVRGSSHRTPSVALKPWCRCDKVYAGACNGERWRVLEE